MTDRWGFRFLVLLGALALQACALRSNDIAPAAVSAAEFAGWPCQRIEEELDAVQRHATRVAYAFDERAGANIVAMGVGMAVFWPALLAMRSTGEDRELLAQLKGRHEALQASHKVRNCAVELAVVRNTQLGSLPLAIGDQLVYEQRAARGASHQQFTLTIAEISREALVLASAGSVGEAQAPAWRADRLGNLLLAGRGPVWPQLLRGDLQLGQVLSGELVDVGDTQQRARVRGQVVAVGPQTVAGRRFDAVVIDLFGDAQVAELSSRLDGVLVIDRGTGVLLRLDLVSGHPAFGFQRRLVRVVGQQ